MKSNWLIKNLIMSLNLIFMQIHPIVIQFDLEFAFFFSIFEHNGVQLGLEFPPKLQFDFPACFLHIASLYFIILFLFFKKRVNFGEYPELLHDKNNTIFTFS
jgi:hypothetical protein